MPKRNFVAMGQAGLTGRTRAAVQPVARAAARWTGRPEAQILSLIGAGFLAISLIDFLRQVDSVITTGRPRRQPGTLPPPVPRTGRGAPSSTDARSCSTCSTRVIEILIARLHADARRTLARDGVLAEIGEDNI